jgi:1-phosphofructokinase family hexose kinase
MIVTITLNPMLDKTVYIERLERGAIHRAQRMEMVAGGKGISVSRQLKHLGLKTIATGFLGGEGGGIVARLLSEEGVDHDFVMTDAMTRDGVTYLEPDGTWTAVFEPSLRIDVRFIHELNKKIEALVFKSTWVVCGGSSPGHEADDLFYEAIVNAHKAGVPSVLDSYGNAFELAMKAQPTLVKPNKREFEITYGRKLETPVDHVDAVKFLLSQGARYCVISDGGTDFFAGVQGHFWRVTPPKVKVVNMTGSGDAMVAGILYGFRQGWKFEQCLAFGAAAGAANARTWDVAMLKLEDITSLESEVVMQRV